MWTAYQVGSAIPFLKGLDFSPSETSDFNDLPMREGSVESEGDSEMALSETDGSVIKVISTTEIKNYIISEAKYYDIDPELALRIAEAESDFRNICCYKGREFGQGIYQFEPITWEEQCEGEVDNIKNNIDCAIKLFSRDEYWRWNSSRSEWQ
uniref:Transglycosylase SLT domain-containing protein n=1 Tax=viral metagenome TaxID=1070528 RepID=A0A6H1ZF92_9ZZZZ